jgi:hypothetical protein
MMGSVSAHADTATFTTITPASDGDGSVAASVQFISQEGGLKVIITNTLVSNASAQIKRGEAVSALSFSLNGFTPSALTNISGVKENSTDIGAGGSFSTSDTHASTFNDPASSNVADHWKFGTTGGGTTFDLASAKIGGFDPGNANPTFMILPSTGVGSSNGSSFAQGNFDPYIIGPGTFLLTVPNMHINTSFSLTTFSNVMLGFGTGADATIATNTTPTLTSTPTVPVPAAAWSGLSLLAGLGVYRKLRRR